MMGAVTPKTCRVTLQWNKSDCILLHLVGLLFNVNYDARNHELKTNTVSWLLEKFPFFYGTKNYVTIFAWAVLSPYTSPDTVWNIVLWGSFYLSLSYCLQTLWFSWLCLCFVLQRAIDQVSTQKLATLTCFQVCLQNIKKSEFSMPTFWNTLSVIICFCIPVVLCIQIGKKLI